MKCEKCGGTGKVQKWFYERTGFGKCEKVCGDVKCEWCNGTGEVEQTNEEWLDSLPTEEKAKTIVCLEVNALHKWKKGLVESDVDEIKRWLKEKHE